MPEDNDLTPTATTPPAPAPAPDLPVKPAERRKPKKVMVVHPNDRPFNLGPDGERYKRLDGRTRLGLDWKGRTVYSDINNLPPLEIDLNGFAIRPPAVGLRRRKNFTEDERKVRFLLMWNYSGMNLSLSCQEAGVTRAIAKEWMKDPVMMKKMEEAQEEIADRMQIRLMQLIGLMPEPAANIRIHQAALFGALKKLRPSIFDETPGLGDGAPTPAESDVPRPSR